MERDTFQLTKANSKSCDTCSGKQWWGAENPSGRRGTGRDGDRDSRQRDQHGHNLRGVNL